MEEQVTPQQPTQETPPPDKLTKLYNYLKKNNVRVHKTVDEFKTAMQDEKTATTTYDYLKKNHPNAVESPDFNSFQANLGLKKKEETSLPPAGLPAQTISPVLESGLTEEEERQRNLTQLDQQFDQGITESKLPFIQEKLEGLNPERPSMTWDQDARAQFDGNRSAEQQVKDFATGVEKEPKSFLDDPKAVTQHAIGMFNQAVVSTLSSIPKSVAIMAKEMNDITGLEENVATEQMATYKLGKLIDKTALELGITATDPDRADSFWQSTVPSAFGSVAGVVLTGGRSPIGSASIGGSVMGVSEFEQAKKVGLSDEEAFNVYIKNYFVGMSEAIPIQRALTRLNKISGGKLSQIAVAGGKGALEEGTQEVFQTYLTNQIAKGSYDPKRDLFKDVIESGSAGAFVGMFLPAIHTAMMKMTPEQKAETNKTLNDTFKEAKENGTDINTGAASVQPEGTASQATENKPETKKPEPVQTQQPDLKTEWSGEEVKPKAVEMESPSTEVGDSVIAEEVSTQQPEIKIPKENAPKTTKQKPTPDVPTADKATAEPTVERTESESEKPSEVETPKADKPEVFTRTIPEDSKERVVKLRTITPSGKEGTVDIKAQEAITMLKKKHKSLSKLADCLRNR